MGFTENCIRNVDGMITVRNLYKHYPANFGRKDVLNGISFDLCSGQRLGILGSNGAGKSTLLRLLSGAEKPSSGQIKSSLTISWPLAFTGAFHLDLTGADNVRFITAIYDQDATDNLTFVNDFAELGLYINEPVRTYSSGMRARLAFAISMIIEFDCFLIDEISAVGDARFHDRCNKELFEGRADRAMVIASHDASYLRERCNRWAVLNDGKMSAFDSFEDAYEVHKEQIISGARSYRLTGSTRTRKSLIQLSHNAALSDKNFQTLVREADCARDNGDWEEAAQLYQAALEIFPYQRSYWVQLGHMRKEQRKFKSSEVCYRTAVALGEPLLDVIDHLLFAVQKSKISVSNTALNLPDNREISKQPPALPDFHFACELFCERLLTNSDFCWDCLRTCSTLDEMFAKVTKRVTFEDWANANFLKESTIHKIPLFFSGCLNKSEITNLVSLKATATEIVTLLQDRSAFHRWPLLTEALADFLSYGFGKR